MASQVEEQVLEVRTSNLTVRQIDQLVAIARMQQFLRRSVGQYPAFVHDGNVVAQDLRFVHVMRCQNDRGAVSANTLHQFPEVAACLWVQAGRRLVEKNQAWTIDQRNGKQQALPLAT